MPANIETMMYVKDVPWHREGVKLDNPATAEEAIRAAGLDWATQLQPLYTGPEHNVLIKDRFVVCRVDRLDQHDGGQLGIVGGNYQPLQNREAFGFLDPVVGVGGAVYHTAGSLCGGKRVWLLAKLPGEIRLVGDDITEKYLLLSNSHDGTSAVRILWTPIRVVCQNTLNLALRNTGGLWIKHQADVVQRVQDAHRLLGIVHETYDRAGEIMRAMVRAPMLLDQPMEYFRSVLPIPKVDERLREKIKARHNRLVELFHTGDGNGLPGVRGTLWAAYNAVTQWADRESYTSRQKEPLRTIWFGDGAQLKERAFSVAAGMVGASLN